MRKFISLCREKKYPLCSYIKLSEPSKIRKLKIKTFSKFSSNIADKN